jgi:hypothetical protein
VVSNGRRALGRDGTRIDPMISLRKVAIRGLSADTRMSCWSGLYPCRVCY